MLYNRNKHVIRNMSCCYITCVMLCYITYVMLYDICSEHVI